MYSCQTKKIGRKRLTIDDLEYIPCIAHGFDGRIYKLDDSTVAKVIPLLTIHKECDNAEYKVGVLLEEFHCSVKMFDSYIIDGVVSSLDEECFKTSRVIIMKYYPFQSILKHMAKPYLFDATNINIFFKVITFQVAFALHNIYKKYPTFRHNDLKVDNVLLEYNDSNHTYECSDSLNKIFKIKNIGLQVKFCDFGFSNIHGVVDNIILLEARTMNLSLGLGYKEDHVSDLFRFVKTLYDIIGIHLTVELRMALHVLYKGHLEKSYKDNHSYAPHRLLKELPTVFEYLNYDIIYPAKILESSAASVKSVIKRNNPVKIQFTKKYIDKDNVANVISKMYKKINMPKMFIKYIVSKVNRYLNTYKCDKRYIDPAITLGFVDAFILYGKPEYGHEYPTFSHWVRDCELKITVEEYYDFAKKWSYTN